MDLLFGGFATLGVLFIAIPLGLIILGLAIVFNGRREEDPTGMRTTSVYFGLVNFVALAVLILGATSIIGSLSSLIIDKEARESTSSFSPVDDFGGGFETDLGDPSFGDTSFGSSADPNDKAIRDTIQGGLLVVPALLVFLFHWRRREAFVASPDFAGSPGLRVDRIYLYAVCFFTALLGSVAVGRGVYDVFRLIIPGITSDLGDNSLERKQALSDFFTMLVLGGSSIYIFFWHWKLVSGESELWRRLMPDRTPSAPEGVGVGTPPPTVGTTPPPPSGPGLATPPATPPSDNPPPPGLDA